MHKGLPDTDADLWTLRIVGLFGLALFLNLVLLVFVLLREDPPFWRNAGGYPTWLRELVLYTFYPLLAVQFLALLSASVCQCCALPLDRAFRLGGLVFLLLLWLVFGIVLGLLLWNNVENLMNGRDLHYHPPPSAGRPD